MEVLDLVLLKALPRAWPREPSFRLELEVMTGQAEHPLGQYTRQRHVVGRPRSGRLVVGRAEVKEVPQEQVTGSVTGTRCPAPGRLPLPGPRKQALSGGLAFSTEGRRKPRWPH